MPTYYFHLRDGQDTLLDPEGVELSIQAVPAAALEAARDCIAHDVKAGRLDLHGRIVVEDESGETVHTLEFLDSVEITLPPHMPAGTLRAVK